MGSGREEKERGGEEREEGGEVRERREGWKVGEEETEQMLSKAEGDRTRRGKVGLGTLQSLP